MRIIEVRPDKPLTDKDKELINKATNVKSIFLAGTIEMGNSENWQQKYIDNAKNFADTYNHSKHYDKGEEDLGSDMSVFIYYNPRRSEAPENLEEQINWELDALEKSDRIHMYLDGKSKSPISLLELGLYARSGKLEVVCPKEFYRYDNVRITCKKYNVPLTN